MKRTNQHSLNRSQTKFGLVALLAACGLAQPALAANVIKANNADNLNLGTSWVAGAPPTSADVAQWDNTVTSANAVNLGASTNWAGIKVIDPAGPVTLNADGNTLSLGASGIDLTLATNSLVINCPLVLTANQYWSATNGQSLTINSTIAGNFTPTIGRYGASGGVFNFTGGSAATPSTLVGPIFNLYSTALNTNNISGYFNTTSASGSKFDLCGGATVNWSAIGTINSGYAWYVGDNNTATAILNVLGGSMTVNSASWNGIGITANCTALVNVAGGSLLFSNNTAILIGANYNNTGSGGNGILTISSGTLDTGVTAGLFELGKGASGSATVNLDGGTLATARSLTSAATVGTIPVFNFNGGTLKANGNQSALLAASVSTVNVRNGGAVIDDGGHAVGIAATLQHSTIGGDNVTDGGLAKNGGGVLTFPGALNHTYNGPTAINAGELLASTLGSCSNSAVTVAAGATNGVQKDVGGISWSCAGLTYAAGSTYLDLNFLAPASLATAPLKVNGNVAINGTLNVIIRGSALWAVGQYPLIKYTGTLSGTVPATPLVLPSGVVATLVNNSANKSIDLNVTTGNGAAAQIVSWAVGSGVWDVNTTANWKDGDGNAAKFVNGETANLDDTATGPSPITVQLDTAVNPAGVLVNNSLTDYTISGTGSITGTNALTKNGTNALTLATANTYSGGTWLNQGVLNISADNNLGNATSRLDIASAVLHVSSADVSMSRPVTVNSNASFVVDYGFNLNLTNNFTNPAASAGSGPGLGSTINLNGGGTLRLAGGAGNVAHNNLFAVENATLEMTGGTFDDGGKTTLAAASGSSVTMNVTGGTFNFTGTNNGNWFVMSDNASAYSTLNISGGTFNFFTTNAQQLLLGNKGNASITVAGGLLHIGPDPSVYLGGHPLYASGTASGTLNITGPGAVVVDASTNVFALAVNSGANTGASGSINLFTGGLLTTARDIQAGTGSSYLNFYGGTLKAGTNSSTFLHGLSQVAISSDGATIDDGGYTITVAQAIQDNGAGFLTKAGVGTLYLDGANAYYGATKVAAGTLGGAGSVLGDLIVSNGAALAPGDAGVPGTFTVGGNFSLAGNLLIDVNTSLTQSNDFVSVTGTLNNAGTGAVIVTNLGPTLAVGEKFTLFSSALPNGNALTVTGGGATWANNLATDGSISVLSVIPTVNTNTFALQSSVSGSTLNLSWPPDRLGWVVQVQTNALNTGLSQNWVTLPGTASVTNYSLPINPANPALFIRMMYQP